MTVHGSAIPRRPAVGVPGTGWALGVVVGVILVTTSLLIAFPPRAADTGGYRLRADREPYVTTPVVQPASIMSYPSGFTATYSPVKESGLVAHPSGFTATYSPLAPMTIVSNYPSGFTATYNPLNETVMP